MSPTQVQVYSCTHINYYYIIMCRYCITGKVGGLVVCLATTKLKSANTSHLQTYPLPNSQIYIANIFYNGDLKPNC